MKDDRDSKLRPLAAVTGLPLLLALAWGAWSAARVPHRMPLPDALNAERRTFRGRAGRLSTYVAGEGAPLLLIHFVNAAASAYEVRPLFQFYRTTRRVYALDLPGYGFSERSERAYTPRLMTDAILDALDLIARETGAQAVDALALSLSGEFLARAASEHPERFRSVALVAPTGFGAREQRYGAPGTSLGSRRARRALEFPVWAQPFYDALVSVPSLRYFLKKTFGSYDAIDPGLLAYCYPTSHQHGARHAPFAFLSGVLFSADIDWVYESLGVPVWLAYGERDGFTDFGDTRNVAQRPNWRLQAFPTGGLPHFEVREAFTSAYDAFLASPRR